MSGTNGDPQPTKDLLENELVHKQWVKQTPAVTRISKVEEDHVVQGLKGGKGHYVSLDTKDMASSSCTIEIRPIKLLF